MNLIKQARGTRDGLLINPAGFTSTSIAILHSLLIYDGPLIEVHISPLFKREAFGHSLTWPRQRRQRSRASAFEDTRLPRGSGRKSRAPVAAPNRPQAVICFATSDLHAIPTARRCRWDVSTPSPRKINASRIDPRLCRPISFSVSKCTAIPPYPRRPHPMHPVLFAPDRWKRETPPCQTRRRS
ncbi:type II 3-dehydroquinate dehydratase [Sagittula sp. NFXS13]|uniref:type II 3-dehydroquinate dehydratase n=1 Tax=Sagittula sp. NFXS13 TaxID=2819095 RepID=UPI0032DE6466